MERITGLEPATQPWKGRMLPLHHIRILDVWKIKISTFRSRSAYRIYNLLPYKTPDVLSPLIYYGSFSLASSTTKLLMYDETTQLCFTPFFFFVYFFYVFINDSDLFDLHDKYIKFQSYTKSFLFLYLCFLFLRSLLFDFDDILSS